MGMGGEISKGKVMKTLYTKTIAQALNVLAREIHSEDGVANAAIAEAADRLMELDAEVIRLETIRRQNYELIKNYDLYGTDGDVSGCIREALRVIGEIMAENKALREKLEQSGREAFACFRCSDGYTPLYCLNCAEALTVKRVEVSQ